MYEMKPPEDRDSDFNPAAVVCARIVCLVYLVSACAAIVCLIYAFATRDGAPLLVGLAAGATAWVCRSWLQQPEHFELIRGVFEDAAEQGRSFPRLEESARPAEKLTALLRDLHALERKRGRRDFDPWALQSLRNEIKSLVAEEPVLRELLERPVKPRL